MGFIWFQCHVKPSLRYPTSYPTLSAPVDLFLGFSGRGGGHMPPLRVNDLTRNLKRKSSHFLIRKNPTLICFHLTHPYPRSFWFVSIRMLFWSGYKSMEYSEYSSHKGKLVKRPCCSLSRSSTVQKWTNIFSGTEEQGRGDGGCVTSFRSKFQSTKMPVSIFV